MPIIYSSISRGKAILAEHALFVGNFSQVIQQILTNISKEVNKKETIMHNQYWVNYILEDNIIYLCISDEDLERIYAFRYLPEIQKKFNQKYGFLAHTALPYSMNIDFPAVMNIEMSRFNRISDNAKATSSQVDNLENQIDEVKNILIQNTEQIVAMGEKLELLIDKTAELENSSVSFRRTSRNIQQKLCFNQWKLILICTVVIIIVIYLLISTVCGGLAWQSCVATKKKSVHLQQLNS